MLDSVRKISARRQLALTEDALETMGIKIGDYVEIKLDPKQKQVILVPVTITVKEKK